ncbi:MAG: hypothetical protein ABII90_11555 [Bacteroidota bacterium]
MDKSKKSGEDNVDAKASLGYARKERAFLFILLPHSENNPISAMLINELKTIIAK